MKFRNLVNIIKQRIAENKPYIQVVIGPRQVGKTTALKEALGNNGVYETADYPSPLSNMIIEEWWAKALNHPSKTLAIDEVQKIINWSEAIKKLWDASDGKIKLILTGSSSLLVEKGLKETLAGRYELIRAEHWNFDEAVNVFDLRLEEFVGFGCYPGSIDIFRKDINRWGQYVRDSIVEPAIGRDLLQLHPVKQPSLLRQVFGSAVSLPCQIISLQKIQGQLQGKGTLPTIQNYLKLLSDAYLVSGVEKYSSAQIRAKKSSPKLIVHDNALIRAFERPVNQELSAEKFGRYFENSIGARLIESGFIVNYWKERDLEVDFVVISPEGEKLAIEVKSSKTREKDLNGLRKFCEINKEFEPCIISLVDQDFKGVKNLSVKKFLSLSQNY